MLRRQMDLTDIKHISKLGSAQRLINSVNLGTRNVVAEFLGKLCLIEPDQLLPRLQAALNSPSPIMRTTVVTAMKFTISDQVNHFPLLFLYVWCSNRKFTYFLLKYD